MLCGAWLYVFSALCGVRAENPSPVPGTAEARKHSDGNIQEIYSQLHLTEGQKKQLDDNKAALRSEMKSIREQLKVCRQISQQELMRPQLNMNIINVQHSRIKALGSQMEDDRLNSVLAVRSILTPEQFSAFVAVMQKHKFEHGKSPDRKEHEEHE